MFQVNFDDDRYLPFEFAGAVSRWRLELPPENNFFDLDTLTDVIMHFSYTAREGGDPLRRAASEVARCHIPGDGLRVFDVRNELPEYLRRVYRGRDRERGRDGEPEHLRERQHDRDDEHDRGRQHESRDWASDRDRGEDRRQVAPWQLDLRFSRSLFPFLPGRRDLRIEGLQVIFEAPDAHPGNYHILRLERWAESGEGGSREGTDIICVVSERWPGCYTGFIPHQAIRRGDDYVDPFRPADVGVLLFPENLGDLGQVFLLCRYDASRSERQYTDFRPSSQPPPSQPPTGTAVTGSGIK